MTDEHLPMYGAPIYRHDCEECISWWWHKFIELWGKIR